MIFFGQTDFSSRRGCLGVCGKRQIHSVENRRGKNAQSKHPRTSCICFIDVCGT